MSLPITFDPAATVDLIDAVSWYEAQRKGLGKEVYAEIIRLATVAASHSTRYQLTSPDIRRVTSRRFPYSVYFVLHQQALWCLLFFMREKIRRG